MAERRARLKDNHLRKVLLQRPELKGTHRFGIAAIGLEIRAEMAAKQRGERRNVELVR